MPSTGPKYSVWWKSLPGRTPSRMPGDHSRPESSRGSGCTSQDSPGPSSVSPARSLPVGSAITGPTCALGSSGQATRSVRVASTSWRRNRSLSPTEPTSTTSDAAEHFCPACPNADCTTSCTARSRSALGVTTIAFLPLVSAVSGRPARHHRKERAVSALPVSSTRSTAGWATSSRPRASSSRSTSWRSECGTPASQSTSARSAPHRLASGAGLSTTPLPAASAASTPPAGMATGKFTAGRRRSAGAGRTGRRPRRARPTVGRSRRSGGRRRRPR